MDTDWKDWDVVENVQRMKMPGFMLHGAQDRLGEAKRYLQEEWEEFVDLLNADGHGTGYERLFTLRDNMKTRKEKLSKEVEKWEDREEWLSNLEGHYHLTLQDLAGIENPSAIWRTRSVNDPVGQLPDAVLPLADRPIVEAFVDFDDDGRLTEWPDLENGWRLRVGYVPAGLKSDDFYPGPEPQRENTTVRYRLSNGELERAGIDPNNLEYPRTPIHMKPSTTWREALLQFEEKGHSVREEKGRPKRTIRVLDFRLRILENVLYRFETFGSVDRLTEGEAKEIAEKDRNDDSRRMMDWENNAAQLYAYAQEHGQPSSMDEWEDETKVSTRQAWDRLRENDYGIGTGANGLYDALNEWAPEFERKYGTQKANRAAQPFNWPDEHEA